MGPRLCRICSQELHRRLHRCDQPDDSFYLCDCGAINTIKKVISLKPPNEWLGNRGVVNLKDAPPRSAVGGYHLEKRRKNRVVVLDFPDHEEEAERVFG